MTHKPERDGGGDAEGDRFDKIFRALPKLGSEEYRKYLKTATEAELPPQVLVRAYRQLKPDSDAANETLQRLLGFQDEHGYLRVLWRAAERRKLPRWMEPGDLVQETITEVAKTLGTSRGKGAEKYWNAFLLQRMEDAYRARVGRRGERKDPEFVEASKDEERGEWIDPVDQISTETTIESHGTMRPNRTPEVVVFVTRELAKIRDDRIREVARDQLIGDHSPMKVLEEKYGVDRFQIRRWVKIAQARLRAAYRKQNDIVDFDIDLLEPE